MNPAIWALLIQALTEFFQKLLETKNEETILGRMADPELHEYRVVRRSLRRRGLRGEQLETATQAALAESRAMTREERIDFLAEARAFDPTVGRLCVLSDGSVGLEAPTVSEG